MFSLNSFIQLFLNDEFVLWLSFSLLLLGLALLARRRSSVARKLAERARHAADVEDLGGNSYFMPLAAVEQAVEIADPVEIDSLLAGEPESVAHGARLQLEAPTDISLAEEEKEFFIAAGSNGHAHGHGHAQGHVRANQPARIDPVLGPQAAESPPVARKPEPATRVPETVALIVPPRPAPQVPRPSVPPATIAVSGRPLPAASPAAGAAINNAVRPAPGAIPARVPARAPAAASGPPTTGEIVRIPVRELVLTWFEARGYRASPAAADLRPMELVLRHRTEPGRVYAFVVERKIVSAERAASLHAQARGAGIGRLLIAAESGSEPGLADQVLRKGIRLFDEDAIRAELAKIDLHVAAKIIAVARRRSVQRYPAGGAAVPRVTPLGPVISAKFP